MTELNRIDEAWPPQDAPPLVLYLGVGGVLQPSRSTYSLVYGRDPFEDGHSPYECAPLLDELLRGWPAVRIVLTSVRPWRHGLPAVLEALGPGLAHRVIGYAFEDLTTKARFGKSQRHISEMEYWRMSRASIVDKHLQWLRPRAWLAVDDEDDGWTDGERACHVVLTPPLTGLLDAGAQAKLHGLLVHQFGPPQNVSALPEPSEGLSRLASPLFDPDQAHRFSLEAARGAFARGTPAPKVLLLGLEGTLFASVIGTLTPRPHLFSFLESCAKLFERLVVMPSDVQKFRTVANELRRDGAVPAWFRDLDCVAWSGGLKDLERIGVFELAEALAVDADRQHIVSGQERQWIGVTAFDGSPGDQRLLTAYESLRALVDGTGGRSAS
ncbi:hypothetical protein CDL60_14315 [Roseateles noduli]|nr:hypothetical protein CDL60_14315 [Roseateles noduli]